MHSGHKEVSQFRNWLRHIWNDHIEELEGWDKKAPDYTMQDYIKKYKWWLKREYRHQKVCK